MNANTIRISICFSFIFMVFVIGLMSSHAIAQTNEANATITQPQEKINIFFEGAVFATLNSSSDHQVKASVGYQTLDPNLLGTKINGVMEISKPNGTLSTVSFPFETAESGRLQFVDIIDDRQIDALKLDVHLTAQGKTEIISNPISTIVSLDDVRLEYGNNAGAMIIP